MYFINSYFTVAVYLALIAGASLAILYWRRSVNANSRLVRMMISCGIDIDRQTAVKADQFQDLDLNAVRTRCRHCPVTDVCDRWLAGEAVVSNSFCPNAWYFMTAADPSQP